MKKKSIALLLALVMLLSVLSEGASVTAFADDNSESVSCHISSTSHGRVQGVFTNHNGNPETTSISGDFTSSAKPGTEFKVTAFPDDGYYFTGWWLHDDTSGRNYDLVSYSRTYSFTANERISLQATFANDAERCIVNGTAGGGVKMEFIQENGNSDSMSASNNANMSAVVKHNTEVTLTATPQDTYAFMGWYDYEGGNCLSTDAAYTFSFTAQTHIKAVFKAPSVVTYKVVNGTWSDGTTKDKTETVQSGSKPAAVPTGMKASEGYTGGAWDTDPTGATITEAKTFTYSFTKKTPISQTVTFKVVNGSWNEGEGAAATADKTVTLSGYEGDTLKLAADQIPAVGEKPDAAYKAGTWDVTPDTETEITKDTTYTYTYAAEDAAVVKEAPKAKDDLTYTGTEQELVTAGTAEGGEILYAIGMDATTAPTTGWSANVPKGTDAGTYYVWYKVVGDSGHYDTEAKPVTVSIAAKSITGAAVTLDTTQLTYNGSEQSVNVTGVTIDGLTLTSDDYTVSGNTGRDKNTYTVTVTGKGNYKDTAAATWQIVEKAMTVTAESITVPYDGQPHGITVNVTDPAEGAVIKYGTVEGTYDLDASPTITDAGTLIVYYKVSAENYTDYTGSATVTVTAVDPPEPPAPEPVSISGAKISIDPQEYTGKAVNPKKITVTLNGTKLTKGTDYTVTYKNNKNIGKGTATITGKGNYTGTKTATFSIVPKKISSASLKYKKKDKVLVFSWKKAAGGIEGYEIEYGTDKKFKSAKKAKVSAKVKKAEYKIEKPTKKKTWYVRIRAWKKVKGKKYYSEWKVVSKKVK